MAFNLNLSRKPEVELNSNLIKEMIEMYGIPAKFLYVDKINKDEVFLDFSHFEVNEEKINNNYSKEIYIYPENPEDWEGDKIYNSFGFYNQYTQHVFISTDTILKLFPDFNTDNGRSKLINNLIIVPSGTILEITNAEVYEPGINNLWGFGDKISTFKLSLKIYDQNIADKNINKIETDINLKEGVSSIFENTDKEIEPIFEHKEEIDTSDIDNFFNELLNDSEIIDSVSEEGNNKLLNKNNTDSVFGDLS